MITFEPTFPPSGRPTPLPWDKNYQGIPIVGTTPDFLQSKIGGLSLHEGRLFERPFEVVAGATAAKVIGDIKGNLAFLRTPKEVDQKYERVGELNPTGRSSGPALLLSSIAKERSHLPISVILIETDDIAGAVARSRS